jgi:hypothetical protein
MTATRFLIDQCYRKTRTGVTRCTSIVVLAYTPREISRNARIESIIIAFQNIQAPHGHVRVLIQLVFISEKIVANIPIIIK